MFDILMTKLTSEYTPGKPGRWRQGKMQHGALWQVPRKGESGETRARMARNKGKLMAPLCPWKVRR
jgi:hypothetical protein